MCPGYVWDSEAVVQGYLDGPVEMRVMVVGGCYGQIVCPCGQVGQGRYSRWVDSSILHG